MPPGRAELAQVLSAVKAPVNVLAAGTLRDLSLADMTAMGVRRVSLGSQMARVTHGAIRDGMAGGMAGNFTLLKTAASGDEIDAILREGSDHG